MYAIRSYYVMKRLESLTPREHEILTYLITGMLNKQIASELKISERTVKAHRKQVLEKVGVASRITSYNVCYTKLLRLVGGGTVRRRRATYIKAKRVGVFLVAGIRGLQCDL